MPRHIPVNGRYIRLRLPQMIIWAAILGACGAALVAGAYFSFFQVDWHVHIGPVRFTWWDKKKWWDGGMGVIHSKSWFLFRHGYRDLGEPAFAVLGIAIALAKPKSWAHKLGALSLIARALLLVITALALITAGIWLLDFGFPAAWHYLLGHRVLTVPGGKVLPNLALGYVIGRVLHIIWAPASATLQGIAVDRAVDKAKLGSGIGVPWSVTPLWVRYPLAPPVVRERFAWIWDHDTVVTERQPVPRPPLPVPGTIERLASQPWKEER